MLRSAGEADRDRDAPGGLELRGGDLLHQPAGEPLGVLRVARGHDDREFLAAEATDDVARAHGRPQGFGEAAQDLVPGPVPVHVVDALEVVDVEHQHGDGVVRAACVRQRGAQAFVKRAVVVKPGQRVRLRLVLEARADLGVVERERRRVSKALRELELVVVEAGVLAEAVDVERALDRVARDQRDRDQRLRLVGRCPRDGHDPGIEVRLVDEHGLAMLDAPAGQADAERTLVGQDLVRPFVTRPDWDQKPARLVGFVNRQRVVGDQVREGICNPVEQRVEALLAEDVVEDVGEAPVRLDERRVVHRCLDVLGNEPQRECVVAHSIGWCSRSGAPFFPNRHTAKRAAKRLESPGRGVPTLCEWSYRKGGAG